MSACGKIVKFRATPEQSKMLTAMYGPKGQMSANMLRVLLTSHRQPAPAYQRLFAEKVTSIEVNITKLLQAEWPPSRDKLTAFLKAAYAGIRLLQELEKHAS